MCVEDHHTIFKASEDLDKAFDELLNEVRELNLAPGLDNGVMVALQKIERVSRFLKRKANVIASTQP
jgi:hypothetical protein